MRKRRLSSLVQKLAGEGNQQQRGEYSDAC
jgi:hypothetical protein